MKLKYLWNPRGRNYRLFTEAGEEIGHFYPDGPVKIDELGWEEITEVPK